MILNLLNNLIGKPNSELSQKRFAMHAALMCQYQHSQLIRVLYEQIANFLVNPRYNIFEGASPNDKFLQFGKFMATLNILQVSRLSFAELENPVFSPYFS